MSSLTPGNRPFVPDDRRCTAHVTGQDRQCENAAIKGGNVCPAHGGRAAQVRLAAQRRLLELAEPAIAAMQRAMEDDNPKVRVAAVAAARDILDRAGLAATQKIEVETMVSSDDFSAYLQGAHDQWKKQQELQPVFDTENSDIKVFDTENPKADV